MTTGIEISGLFNFHHWGKLNKSAHALTCASGAYRESQPLARL
ncbi:hypothetical protein [Pantoea agglomerans]|nr:hypothetical protein [Pantoea agglomerans]